MPNPTPQQLYTELSTDPMNVGYAAAFAAGDTVTLASLINALTGPGAGTVVLGTAIAKNSFLTATAPAAVRLALGIGADGTTQLTATQVAGWNAALVQARAADPGSLIDLGVISALAAALGGDPVSTKIMTSAEYATMTSRIGSRAEVLWGAGVVPLYTDVALALQVK